MTASGPARKRFQIQRLEERIAPGFLFLGLDIESSAVATDQFQDAAISGNVATLGKVASLGAIAGTPTASLTDVSVFAAMPPMASASAPGVNVASQASQSAQAASMPIWAVAILDDIDRRFNTVNSEAELAGPAEAAAQSTKLDQILADVNRHLDMMRADLTSAEQSDAHMPGWAEELLGEIQHHFDGLGQQPTATSNAAMSGVDQDCEMTATDWQVPSARISPQERAQMPAWANSFLAEIDRRFNRSQSATANFRSRMRQTVQSSAAVLVAR